MTNPLQRTFAQTLFATAFALASIHTAQAAYVQADLTRVGGNTWDALFTVGEGPGQTLAAFSVYFDWSQVSNLLVLASPIGWDSIAIQGDSALASDALFDALATTPGVSAGLALGGFTARFDWADPAGPLGLRYTVNDPVTFAVVEAGAVALKPAGGGGTVPLPGTPALVLLGLACAIGLRPSQPGSKT